VDRTHEKSQAQKEMYFGRGIIHRKENQEKCLAFQDRTGYVSVATVVRDSLICYPIFKIFKKVFAFCVSMVQASI